MVGITAAESIHLLLGQLRYFSEHQYRVYLLAPASPEVQQFCDKEAVTYLPIRIVRSISPVRDFFSLVQILIIFLKVRPDIVNLGTPKVSFLGMMAAYLAGVKIRIYTCRGLRFQHESGWKRKLLKWTEKRTARLAHRILAISPSLSDKIQEEQIAPKDKIHLIGMGSSNGIDVDQFSVEAIDLQEKARLITHLNLQDKYVCGYVGRIVDRKGIKQLYQAFDAFYQQHKEARLLVLGVVYQDQLSDKTLIDKLNAHPAILMLGWKAYEKVPLFLSLMDVFLLPAWWEGFGNVLIQAAAMGVPIIASDTTGCKDAVKHNYNGILVPTYDEQAFLNAMLELNQNEILRKKFIKNGPIWARNFNSHSIWQGQQQLYEIMLRNK